MRHLFSEPEEARLLIVVEHAVLWVEDFFQQQHEELLPTRQHVNTRLFYTLIYRALVSGDGDNLAGT